MKNYLTVYLKIFFGILPFLLPVGIIFGIFAFFIGLIFLASSSQINPESLVFLLKTFLLKISVLSFLGSIVLLSGFFSLIIGTLHIIAVNNSSYSNVDGAINVRHKRNLNLQKPYDKAFDLCLASLASIGVHDINTAVRTEGRIYANTRISWKTWSDKITFQLRKISENETEIEVLSRPAIPMALIDYGKNLGNIEIICHFLTKPQNE